VKKLIENLKIKKNNFVKVWVCVYRAIEKKVVKLGATRKSKKKFF